VTRCRSAGLEVGQGRGKLWANRARAQGVGAQSQAWPGVKRSVAPPSQAGYFDAARGERRRLPMCRPVAPGPRAQSEVRRADFPTSGAGTAAATSGRSRQGGRRAPGSRGRYHRRLPECAAVTSQKVARDRHRGGEARDPEPGAAPGPRSRASIAAAPRHGKGRSEPRANQRGKVRCSRARDRARNCRRSRSDRARASRGEISTHRWLWRPQAALC